LKQAAQKKSDRRPLAIQMSNRIREGLLIVIGAIALFLLVSFLTYNSSDPGWMGTGNKSHIVNWGGRVGAFLSDVLLSLFGYVAYLIPPLTVFAAWLALRPEPEVTAVPNREWILKAVGFGLIVASSCGLMNFGLSVHPHLPITAGGIVGDLIGNALLHTFNPIGGLLFLVTIFLCGVTLFSGLSWLGVIDFIGATILQWWEMLRKKPVTPLVPIKVVEKTEPTFFE
jgi:S-DNA-T family DNA segregation ATPase FtsK/SpoIIIE